MDKPLEAIELTRELTINGRTRKPGEVVSVREVGELTAQQLIDNKRAKRAAADRAETK